MKKSNINNITPEFLESLKKEKERIINPRTGKLGAETAEKIITDLKNLLNFNDPQQAMASVAVLFQQGGTARSCDGNLNTVIFGTTVKLADIRRVLKDNRCVKSERKLARSYATSIKIICEALQIPGNLSSKIIRKYPEMTFTIEEKVWMSDFQSDNEDAPSHIRTLIMDTYKK
jgi:hypothetical protein